MKLFRSWKYTLIVCGATLISLADIIYAACNDYKEGGRGGAFAAILAILGLVARADHGAAAQEALKELADKQNAGQNDIMDALNSLNVGLYINADGQRRQTWVVAIASAVATAAWGFGDIAAQWLQGNDGFFNSLRWLHLK